MNDMLEPIIQATIIGVIMTGIGGIFVYIRKKFNCQNTIQTQLNDLDTKINTIIKINMILLEKTHPEEVKEYKKLLDLGLNKSQ